MSQHTRVKLLEIGAAYLNTPEIMARFPDHIQAGMKNGTKEFALAEYYIRKRFAGGMTGIQQMIKETDDRVNGVTNLDKGKLPEETYVAIVAVGLAYGYHATSAEVTACRYSNSEYLNTIPTKLVNSEFRLKCGDRTIVNARTKKFFANAYSEYGVEANEENVVVLPQPKLGDPKKLMQAEFEFAADAVLVPANNHFTEVLMVGVKVVDRVMN